jgi:hypothetical protein
MREALRAARNAGWIWCAAALLAAPAHAAVTIEETLRVEGAGLLRMMNMSGRTVTTIAGDRARTDSELQMESRLMRMFGGQGATAEIVRLDEERTYALDLAKKQYTEMTFAEQRADLERTMAQVREAQQSQQQGMSGIDESECEWSPPAVTLERRPDAGTIAGYGTEQVTIVATQSCADRKTGQVCDFRLTLNQWLAPGAEGSEEARKFWEAYHGKLGLAGEGSRDFAQRAESMFGAYGPSWQEIAERVRDLEGLPVKSRFGLAIGGPQCQGSQQAAQSTAGPGVGEAIGGALGGALGGMLGRRRDAAKAAGEPPAEAAATADAGAMVEFVTLTSELVSVTRAPADPQRFEVPAGFRKAAR